MTYPLIYAASAERSLQSSLECIFPPGRGHFQNFSGVIRVFLFFLRGGEARPVQNLPKITPVQIRFYFYEIPVKRL